MKIQNNVSLKQYNTFGIDVPASQFVEIKSIAALQDLLKAEDPPDFFVLSGGSNLLLTGPVYSLVLYIDIPVK